MSPKSSLPPLDGLPVLITAAGHGRRMGQPKLFVSHQGKSFLQHILERCRESRSPVTLTYERMMEKAVLAHLETITETINETIAASTAPAGEYPQPRLVPANGNHPMLASVRAALRLGGFEPGFWLWPVDAPFISPAGWDAATAAVSRDPSVIWKLRYRDKAGNRVKTGHPTWFPFYTIPAIMAGNWNDGLRGLMKESPPERIQVLQLEDEILTDFNTPEELARLDEAPVRPGTSGRHQTVPPKEGDGD